MTKNYVHDQGAKNAEKRDRDKRKWPYRNENAVGPFVGL